MNQDIELDFNFTRITFRKDGILHLHYADHYFTIEETKELFAYIRKNAPWDVSPIYITGDSFTGQDNESKTFNGSVEVTKHCSAIAIASKSLGQKIIANFYMKTIKPNSPTKFFNDEDSAINWLKEYL